MKSYNLGPLEQEIMECLWKNKSLSVSGVQRYLKKRKRDIAYTTTMTITARLEKKGLLTRRLIGKAYSYSPKVSKEQALKNIVKKTISSLINQYGTEAVTAFTSEIKKHK